MGVYGDENLIRKGVYPYEFMDSMEKFSHPSLTSASDFNSALTGRGISMDDYQFAQNMWTKYNCQTMLDYHDLYLSTDVLLLTDIVENFRTICLNIYELDPCHYVSSPALAFDAMLKYTGVELGYCRARICTSSLNKELGEGFQQLHIGMLRRITHRYLGTIHQSLIHSFYTWMPTTSMAGQCPRRCHIPSFNGNHQKWTF